MNTHFVIIVMDQICWLGSHITVYSEILAKFRENKPLVKWRKFIVSFTDVGM